MGIFAVCAWKVQKMAVDDSCVKSAAPSHFEKVGIAKTRFRPGAAVLLAYPGDRGEVSASLAFQKLFYFQ